MCLHHPPAGNTANKDKLKSIFRALQKISNDIDVILPLHPRTRKKITEFECKHHLQGIKVLEPLSYLAMSRLEISAKAILTDSGGIPKKAFFTEFPASPYGMKLNGCKH